MNKILVVDDSDISRGMMVYQFYDSYEMVEAENGREALEKLEEYDDISAVILDLIMPEMDGIEVLRQMKKRGMLNRIPVFVVTADRSNETLTQAFELGAVDIITKPINANFIRKRIGNVIELYSHRNSLADEVFAQDQQIETFNVELIEMLASLIEFRNAKAANHSKFICAHTRLILRKFCEIYPEYEIPYDQILKIANAAILYDIGKIAIPEKILFKPESLSKDEFEAIKEHAQKGEEILRRFPDVLEKETYNYALDICLCHHERFDGEGYPRKLKGEEIPVWAQVVSVVDAFNALIAPRAYRKAFSAQIAAEMIKKGECGAFNPKIIEAFDACLPIIFEQLQES